MKIMNKDKIEEVEEEPSGYDEETGKKKHRINKY